jgi:ribonuclease HII
MVKVESMSVFSIAEIEERLHQLQEVDGHFIDSLKSDHRKGVQQLVSRWLKKLELENQAHEKFIELNQFEYKLRAQGFQYIVGIDEVGRGPLAGPVVAAAVILPDDFYVLGIDDSKKLTEAKRDALYEEITSKAVDISIGIISAEEIDQINIYEATKRAMLSAVTGLQHTPDFLLIDAMKLDTPYPYEAIIKGDAKSISIAAASIIAKVTRDRMMKELALQFPEYGFDSNMGYGTKVHLEALQTKGITPFHRKSFAPIKDM